MATHDHLGAVAGAELAGDPGQVALHGQRGQAQGLADLLVRAAVGDQLEHLDLAAGERLRAGEPGGPGAGRERVAERSAGPRPVRRRRR